MRKVLLAVLLGMFFLTCVTSCGNKRTTEIAINSDEIVSVSISAYPIMFANGDSIDTTTDISKITNIVTAFNKVTFKYYKNKEEWKDIDSSSTGKEQTTITFYDADKKCVESLSKITNVDGSFIIKRVDEDIYTASEEDYNKLSNIFDDLIKEAKDGRLSD